MAFFWHIFLACMKNTDFIAQNVFSLLKSIWNIYFLSFFAFFLIKNVELSLFSLSGPYHYTSPNNNYFYIYVGNILIKLLKCCRVPSMIHKYDRYHVSNPGADADTVSIW